jgi:hypothetical protein
MFKLTRDIYRQPTQKWAIEINGKLKKLIQESYFFYTLYDPRERKTKDCTLIHDLIPNLR